MASKYVAHLKGWDRSPLLVPRSARHIYSKRAKKVPLRDLFLNLASQGKWSDSYGLDHLVYR